MAFNPCLECGACCKAGYLVEVSPKEAEQIPEKYLDFHSNGFIHIMDKDGRGMLHVCPLYDSKKKRCKIYDHRPSVCREYDVGGFMCQRIRESFGMRPFNVKKPEVHLGLHPLLLPSTRTGSGNIQQGHKGLQVRDRGIKDSSGVRIRRSEQTARIERRPAPP